MKLAIITDSHWGVRNDSSVFHDYFEKFYMDFFFPYLEEHDIKWVLHGGDITDRRKFINYVTKDKMDEYFVQACIDRGIRLDVVIGNHDIFYRNTNRLNSMSKLYGKDYESKGIYYYDSPQELDVEGISIALIPWINRENHAETMNFIDETKAQIALGHLELTGFEMYRGMPNTHGMDPKIFEKFDIVMSGHFHHKSSRGNIHYLGSPYEMTWHDYNDRRGFHILDTETRELTFVQNPYRIFQKLFYNDENAKLEDFTKIDLSIYKDTYVKVIIQKKTNPYWYDILLDRLYNENPANVKVIEDMTKNEYMSEEEILDEAEDTLTIINKFVDGMNTNLEKNTLHALMSNLYLEASQMEI